MREGGGPFGVRIERVSPAEGLIVVGFGKFARGCLNDWLRVLKLILASRKPCLELNFAGSERYFTNKGKYVVAASVVDVS